MENAKNHPLFSNFSINQENKNNNVYQEFIEVPNNNKIDYKNIYDRFDDERVSWTQIVDDLSKKLKDINNIADLQVNIYSQRQKAVEYYHYLMSLLSKKNKEYRSLYKERFEFYSFKYDYARLKDDVKNSFINNDLSELYSIKEALDNHMKFIDKTISTLDNIIYGIKHRISLEEYRRRL